MWSSSGLITIVVMTLLYVKKEVKVVPSLVMVVGREIFFPLQFLVSQLRHGSAYLLSFAVSPLLPQKLRLGWLTVGMYEHWTTGLVMIGDHVLNALGHVCWTINCCSL